jgi:hypothetical protein|eukprot:SAG25_NODE_115_length_14839_cov_35.722524_6_plen_89_part_00
MPTCANAARFVLTFLVLHTVHYLAAFAYSRWCLDLSLLGYFINMINGHGPVCHTLMMVAYHSQHSIYTLLSTAMVGAGITWLADTIGK